MNDIEKKLERKKKDAERYQRNKEEIKLKRKEKYWANPEKAREKVRKSYHINADKRREDSKKWREKNPEKVKYNNKKFHTENKERYAITQKKWRELNKEKMKEYHKEYGKKWQQLNKARKREQTVIRRTLLSNATPKWLSSQQREEIKSVYLHARDCELISGEKYHVDHIMPLNGKNICGLHVPWNLQVLPSDINMSKGNSF